MNSPGVSLVFDLRVVETALTMRASEAQELAEVLLAVADAIETQAARELPVSSDGGGSFVLRTGEHVVDVSPSPDCDGDPCEAAVVEGCVHGLLGELVWLAVSEDGERAGTFVCPTRAREAAVALRAAIRKAEAHCAPCRPAVDPGQESADLVTGDVP